MTTGQVQMPPAAIIAHRDPEIRERIRSVIQTRTRIHGECDTRGGLEKLHSSLDDGVVVSGVDFPDGDGLESLIRLGEASPLPVVIITNKRSLDLVEKAARDHVMAYLIEPLDVNELLAAMVLAQQRFGQLQDLRQEVENLQQALEDRKVIEQAKGILMASQRVDEAEAYRTLRSQAQARRMKLAALAQEILSNHKTD